MSMHASIPERTLGDTLSASSISFGAMGMSEFYGTPPDDNASLIVLDRALELGVSMFDTADMYGRGHNERLLAAFIARHPGEHLQGQLRIATKFGIDRDPHDGYKRRINNDPDYIRKACDASLKRLGVDRIDLYYAHRINPDEEIAETMDVLVDLKHQGKIAHIGLCEVSASTLEKAHAVHPVAAVQTEYSLWTRDPEHGVLEMCRNHGIGLVAYSPLGRGFLSGTLTSTEHLEADDFRLFNPRFQGDNLQSNLALLPVLRSVAEKHACTQAQVALSWLLSRYEHLVVIPGTRTCIRLEENCRAAHIKISEEDMQLLNATFTLQTVHGERYSPEGMKGLNA